MGLYFTITLASYALAALAARKSASQTGGILIGTAVGTVSLFVSSIMLGFLGYLVSFDQVLYWFSNKILGGA